jgi:hypothetical protein
MIANGSVTAIEEGFNFDQYRMFHPQGYPSGPWAQIMKTLRSSLRP